ncbi:MAG: hypothetical protein A2X85_17495 [Geobacteraceae bacterium GWF2_54_21]|nr:MAG: hypothetical protein A2X85_17495 [Geobacteraceae bacterium GWF2_54_21]
MSARYDRYIDNFDIAKKEGYVSKVADLIKGIKSFAPGCEKSDYAFDIHLREKSQIMIYHGGTCLLTFDLSKIKDGTIRFTSKSYGESNDDERKACVQPFQALKEISDVHDADLLIDKVCRFLKKAITTVKPKFYLNNTSEGYWSSKLSIDYGRNWTPDNEWLIIDREAVIGFNSTDKKIASEVKGEFYSAIKQEVGRIKQNPDFSGWADVSKSFGDELDCLAIGRDGQILCIELKHGDNTSGIYWGPLQAKVYQMAFEEKMAELSKSIIEMVLQKIELGMLPPEALERIPVGGFRVVKGILAVADAEGNLDSKCWQRANDVNCKLSYPVSMVRSFTKSGNLKWESFSL